MALTPAVIQTVKSTAPLLKDRARDITTRFYSIMFAHHPEVRPLFNFANQQPRSDITTQGQQPVGRQAQALAAAVYAFAENVDNLGALTEAVERIAHKHASLHVLPEHYPIVGGCLLRAIREVTGAPDGVIDAWAAAYGVLADALIAREAALRQESEAKAGGWSGFREFVVVRKELETNEVVSLYLKPVVAGQPLPAFQPGQYLSLREAVVGSPWGVQTRNYTLSDAPGREHLRVTVKREVGGTGTGGTPTNKPHGVLSTHVHDGIQEGSVLQVGPPYGHFFLGEEAQRRTNPLVFCSTGIGLTPTVSMVNRLLDTGAAHRRSVLFLHGTRNGCTHVMRQWMDQIRAHPNFKVHVAYSRPTVRDVKGKDYDAEGRLGLADVRALGTTPEADFYFTGTLPFMHGLRDGLRQWGVPAANIHYETFGPDVLD